MFNIIFSRKHGVARSLFGHMLVNDNFFRLSLNDLAEILQMDAGSTSIINNRAEITQYTALYIRQNCEQSYHRSQYNHSLNFHRLFQEVKNIYIYTYKNYRKVIDPIFLDIDPITDAIFKMKKYLDVCIKDRVLVRHGTLKYPEATSGGYTMYNVTDIMKLCVRLEGEMF